MHLTRIHSLSESRLERWASACILPAAISNKQATHLYPHVPRRGIEGVAVGHNQVPVVRSNVLRIPGRMASGSTAHVGRKHFTAQSSSLLLFKAREKLSPGIKYLRIPSVYVQSWYGNHHTRPLLPPPKGPTCSLYLACRRNVSLSENGRVQLAESNTRQVPRRRARVMWVDTKQAAKQGMEPTKGGEIPRVVYKYGQARNTRRTFCATCPSFAHKIGAKKSGRSKEEVLVK